ncbi:MAG TPA: hypothetical protein VM689_03820 [Aliidongia sp.]|nr:hypothetical protein [Aliidongia sp.]
MTTKEEAEAQTLIEEMRQLRADFARIGETVRGMVDHHTAELKDTAAAAAETAWKKAKGSADTVVAEIDSKPIASALIALGVGLVLGSILFSRRH